MSLKRKLQPDEPSSASSPSEIYRSSPITDRDSTFIGYFAPTLKPKELQDLGEIQSASHKMAGWRKQSNQRSITQATQYVSGSDDDGEKYGGKRIEQVLQTSRVVGTCVVARWYGGVMLGPVRFKHIEQVAREAIQKWQDEETANLVKRRKVEEEEAEHIKLSKSLSERDGSIVVLRELAAKKERELKDARAGDPNDEVEDTAPPATVPPSSSAQAATNYTEMPLDRLRAFDKARDATLGFLLKRIDKAEAELAEYQQRIKQRPP